MERLVRRRKMLGEVVPKIGHAILPPTRARVASSSAPRLDSASASGSNPSICCAASQGRFAILPRITPEPPAKSKITIKRRHGLDHKQAKSAAEKIARDLKSRFDLEYAWEGDHIAFERPGLTGTLQVGKTAVRLDVELSFLLSALKGPIEQAIQRELDALFKKS